VGDCWRLWLIVDVVDSRWSDGGMGWDGIAEWVATVLKLLGGCKLPFGWDRTAGMTIIRLPFSA